LQRLSFVFDVVIAGGGPAGLSAALILGRCRRRVLLCDTGRPRNQRSQALHGYLSRDCVPPLDLLRFGREELQPYGIESRTVEVMDVHATGHGFDVGLANGDQVEARTVLLATGVQDHPPAIPGLAECYGISIHHCPYCDGWEHRDKTIAVIGSQPSPAGLALSLRTWTSRLVVCTLGRSMAARQRQQLAAHGIPIHTERAERIDHRDGQVEALVLSGGTRVACDAIFFTAPQSQQCELARRLGCEFTTKGTVKTDHLGKTCVEGIYVVGDASRDVQFAIVAAAEGAKAGVAINQALQARAGLAGVMP
jgi:thioredoxin reductase